MERDSGRNSAHAEGDAIPVGAHPLLPEVALPADWARMARVHEVTQGITLTCWSGSPASDLEVSAKGPPMFCIGVLLEGRARMSLDGGPVLELRPGMAVVQTAARPASGRFAMRGGQSSRMVDIRFSHEGLQRAGGRPLVALQGRFLHDCSLTDAQWLMGGFPAPAALLRVASDILTCEFADETVRKLYLQAKALEALAIALQTVGPAAPSASYAREKVRLLQARRLLDERFGEDWTIVRLAREVGLGEKKLQAGFRAMAGRSVHEHLREVRLAAAAALLADGVSVTEAAAATGFGSLSHFSKAFRAERGVLPSQWRDARPI